MGDDELGTLAASLSEAEIYAEHAAALEACGIRREGGATEALVLELRAGRLLPVELPR